MWTRTHSQFYPNVKTEAVWSILKDVNNWPKWHGDLEYCRLEGSFIVGNHFLLKPKRMSPVKIILTEIEEGKQFTDCTQFFGAKMYDTHVVERKEGGVVLTNHLVVTGRLRWLWIKLVAQNVADSVPEEMDALIELARRIRHDN